MDYMTSYLDCSSTCKYVAGCLVCAGRFLYQDFLSSFCIALSSICYFYVNVHYDIPAICL